MSDSSERTGLPELNAFECLMYVVGVFLGGLTALVGPPQSAKTVLLLHLIAKLVAAGKICLLADMGAPWDLMRKLGLLMSDGTGHLGLDHLEPRLFADLEREICKYREVLHCAFLDQLAGLSLFQPQRDRYSDIPKTREEDTVRLIAAQTERVNQLYRLRDCAHNFGINIVLAVDPSVPHLPDVRGFGTSESNFPEIDHISDALFFVEPLAFYDIDYCGPRRYRLVAKKLPTTLAKFEGQSCVLELDRRTAELTVVQG